MLTYADVQRIYRLEKNSSSLQKIPDNFYSELKKLLSQVGEDHQSYLKRLASEIQEKRKNKLLIQAMRGRETPENAIPRERKLYTEMTQLLQEYEENVFSSSGTPSKKEEAEETKEEKEVPEEKRETPPEKPAEEKNQIKLKILKSLPEIMSPNSKTYGPFPKDSEVTLPKKIAKILLKRGAAEKV